MIEAGAEKIFNFTFQWLNSDSDSLKEFEKLFIMHYWEWEIGYETIALFKMKLRELWTRTFPKWKFLYDSQDIIEKLSPENPLYNRFLYSNSSDDLNENIDTNKNGNRNDTNTGTLTDVNTFGRTESGSDKNITDYGKTSTDKGSSEAQNQGIQSNNPQVNFAGKDYASNMDRNRNESEYSASVTEGGKDTTTITYSKKTDDSENKTNTRNLKNDSTYSDIEDKDRTMRESHESEEKGFVGDSLSQELLRYRSTFINIYDMMIKDMEILFLGIQANPYMEGGAW